MRSAESETRQHSYSIKPGWRNGKRGGLKIRCRESGLRVQAPSPARRRSLRSRPFLPERVRGQAVGRQQFANGDTSPLGDLLEVVADFFVVLL
jgi:hypothetical protein